LLQAHDWLVFADCFFILERGLCGDVSIITRFAGALVFFLGNRE
jgi:hypothetical protein